MALKDILADRRAQIEKEIKGLKAELAEIRVAEKAIGAVPPVRGKTGVRRGGVREGSIKDWILKALAEFDPHGLETEEVIHAVEAMGSKEVPRNSMTPQLSRLKAAGLITQEGRKWKFPPTHIVAAQLTLGSNLEEDPLG